MTRITRVLSVFLLMSGLLVGTGWAQTQTGTVQGKIVDQQGGVLPGVTVTLTGPRGQQVVVTGGEGEYMFVGVQPATYVIKVELSGFLPQERTDVIVGMGKTVLADFTLKVGGVSETIEVVGTTSTVDVKSSATETSVSSDLLAAMPIYDSTSSDLLDAAPGINLSSAYGGQGYYGNALLLDGVDTRDPEGGSAWTFFNQNLIEDIQIGGLGAPAEYGGFTGAIVNTITKSGGNEFSGLFSIRYTKSSLASDNISNAILEENPSLGSADITNKLVDYTVQLGGPIKQNKAFFFSSIQRFSADYDPTGPRTSRTEVSPRFNVKFTLQPSQSDTLILGMQYDSYNVTGRVGWWSSDQATDNATVTEDAPEWVWNAQYRRVFGTKTLFEAKLTGYTGYYYLDPVDPAPPTYDGGTGEYGGGGGGIYYADRSRNQLQVSLTQYAEKYGRHSFKFGAEIERSHVRSQYKPYGPAGYYTYLSYGVPYYQISYSYDVQGNNHRVSAYAQDQWNVGRLTLNLGLRLDHIRGYSPVLAKDVYIPKDAWGPRVGAAYDVMGTGMTVVKAFWGRYYEGAASLFFSQATPGISDYVTWPINPDGSLGEPTIDPGIVYGISPDIRHPRTDEFNVAWETQITKDMRVTATGVYRKGGTFINNVIKDALWQPVTLDNAFTGSTFTGYSWANRDESNTSYYIRNPDGFQYVDVDGNIVGTAAPSRTYKALMLVLNRSLKQRLGFQVSYVLSKAEGTLDNGDSDIGSTWNYLSGTAWDSPNTALINTFGELTNSRRHEIKAYLTYLIPRVEVMISPQYYGYSGRPYAPYDEFSSDELNLPSGSRRRISLAPRGSERNDFFHEVDLRAEKYFQVRGGHRFGIYVDIINLFNTASIEWVNTRYPSTSIGGNTVLFGAPTEVQGARQASFGGRWSF
jgi:hypothetical protein